jgi:hypothetical protein
VRRHVVGEPQNKNMPENRQVLTGMIKEISTTDRVLSVSLASLANDKKENCDQSSGDQHPVLAFEAQQRKAPNQKLHRSRPQFCAE